MDDNIGDEIEEFCGMSGSSNELERSFKADTSFRKLKKALKLSQRPHACCHCSSTFSFPNKLRKHIQSCHSLTHKCDRCDAKFNRFNQLRTHVAFAHKIRHYCEHCSYSSSVKSELRKHIVVNHQNGVRCTIDGCSATLAYNRLKRHIRKAHHEMHILNECSKTNRSTSSVDLKCGRCDFLGENQEDLMWHIENAHVSGIVCPVGGCEKRFLLPDLQYHLDTAHLELLKDDSVMNSNGSVVEHISQDSSSSTLSNTVEISDMDFSSTSGSSLTDCRNCSDLIAGSAACSTSISTLPNSPCQSQGFSCDTCFKHFAKRRDLVRHQKRVHENVYFECQRKKFLCPIENCSRSFSSSSKLHDHINKHDGKVLFTCAHCVRDFKSRAHYAVHLRHYHNISIRKVMYASHFVQQICQKKQAVS